VPVEKSGEAALVTRTSVQDTSSTSSSSTTPTQQEKPLKKEKVVANLSGLVEEGGLNFSTGERQLVCLARAILQRNRILIMDEATANIDLETDKKVQRAIHEQFSNQGTTVITIAHRLHTVIDCDQILVLAHGELCEDGSPHQLLSDYFGDVQLPSAASDDEEESFDIAELQKNDVSGITPPRHSFASLVKQTGPEMCYRLRKLAKSAAAAATHTTTDVKTSK
jgi:ABC-type multidrug transport system ATPase subunit